MGFSWSLYFCQSVGESAVARCLPEAVLVNDRGPLEFPAKRRALVGVDVISWVRFYIYVDNLGAFAGSPEEARAALDAVIADLAQVGLIIHETEVSGTDVEALGTFVDLTHLTAGVTGRRLKRTRAALRVAARRAFLSGRMVEVLVGHATFCGLARRVSLAIFDAVYKFIQSAGDERVAVWDNVRRELRAFAGIMVFLHGVWTDGWHPRVTSFDASLTGWGVTEAFFEPEFVGRIGRIPERS